MTDYFDPLETRDPSQREVALFNLLPGFLKQAVTVAPGWARQLDGFDLAAVTSRAALARLPVLRKSDLKDLQAKDPPLGGFVSTEPGAIVRLFVSPGPILEIEGPGRDFWRGARALHAAGLRQGDLVINTFGYHLTPGGFCLDSGARALGCTVIPAGPANTDQQLELIALAKPAAYIGTPDFLKILLDKADAAGKPITTFKKALVSGGALFPSLREFYTGRDIAVSQAYATADLGLVAYETEAREGLVVDEGVIVEIVRPGTGDPVALGEVGEVVVTSFNRYYPMIRFATGDLSAVLPGVSPCGRTNMRIKGWLGRADQTTKVKGMFVTPGQVADAVKRMGGEIGRARLTVARQGETDAMTLSAEAAKPSPALEAKLAEAVRAATKLAAEIKLVAPGSLPNDGKVISDERTYG